MSSSSSQAQIETLLAEWIDPNLGVSLVAAKSVKKIEIENSCAKIKIVLGYPSASCRDALAQAIKAKVHEQTGLDAVVEIGSEIISHAVQKNLKPMPGVKNIIAIASGKGGVGKSTTAVNLALALSAEGARVGILDADIYGPSQPAMLGLSGKPEIVDEQAFLPKTAYGVQSMSIGYMIEADTPMIWRGPMATGALQQLIRDTRWDKLDYLIVDLPPGTGDIQLTLAQQIPVSGAVIVTTPQDIALLDAQKGLKMFEQVSVPVLGIVENMSMHICSNCGHEEPIFGSGGGARMAQKYGVELLGTLPLDIRIREQADGGHPTVVADPQGRSAQIYREIARKMAGKLALKAKDYSSKFPTISIVNN
jgi:ATP-binding protein involved in chromosome partitioning